MWGIHGVYEGDGLAVLPRLASDPLASAFQVAGITSLYHSISPRLHF
jgi:hypothetical protein